MRGSPKKESGGLQALATPPLKLLFSQWPLQCGPVIGGAALMISDLPLWSFFHYLIQPLLEFVEIADSY